METVNVESQVASARNCSLEGDAVLAALQSLPPRQRVAISLRYLDDHSVAEIATVMEIDYRAAESLIARGRRRLIMAWEER